MIRSPERSNAPCRPTGPAAQDCAIVLLDWITKTWGSRRLITLIAMAQ
jgi:hypothetical protein